MFYQPDQLLVDNPVFSRTCSPPNLLRATTVATIVGTVDPSCDQARLFLLVCEGLERRFPTNPSPVPHGPGGPRLISSVLRYRAISPVRRTNLEWGEGRGIISSSHMTSNVREWPTEFVVGVLSVTVDYEAAFQPNSTRVVASNWFRKIRPRSSAREGPIARQDPPLRGHAPQAQCSPTTP